MNLICENVPSTNSQTLDTRLAFKAKSSAECAWAKEIASVASARLHTGFEGPEKKIELILSDGFSLRTLGKPQWQEILNAVKCEIISEMHGAELDAYVLSESSLFVYDHKVMIKTCGTTTLLLFVQPMLELCRAHNLSIEFVLYCRKNYSFPEVQRSPHTSLEEEIQFLDKHFHGKHFLLGSRKTDHWLFYVSDMRADKNKPLEHSFLEIKMHECHPRAMAKYFRANQSPDDSARFTSKHGIDAILSDKDSRYDQHLFEPCGYSMNGIHSGQHYSTVHVTPELHCSYVSYETNAPLDAAELGAVLQRVLALYEPASYSLTLFNASAQLPSLPTLSAGSWREVAGEQWRVGYQSHVSADHVCYPLYVARLRHSGVATPERLGSQSSKLKRSCALGNTRK